jgi:hypothetical protein
MPRLLRAVHQTSHNDDDPGHDASYNHDDARHDDAFPDDACPGTGVDQGDVGSTVVLGRSTLTCAWMHSRIAA